MNPKADNCYYFSPINILLEAYCMNCIRYIKHGKCAVQAQVEAENRINERRKNHE
jgi:hypothetical protein